MTVIARQDCILDIGAGDSFADIYGLKRFLFLWASKMMALARHVPIMLSPQNIGPFTRQPYRMLAKLELERADCVVARDEESLRVPRELATRATAVQSVDVEFELPFADRSAERGGARLRVGVSESGRLVGGGDS